jgi:hypothetical protein
MVTVGGTCAVSAASVRAAGSILAALQLELTECRRRQIALSRQVGVTELQLWRLDREQQRVYRRTAQLAEAIAGEEEQLRAPVNGSLPDLPALRHRPPNLETVAS